MPRPKFMDREFALYPTDRDSVRDEWVNPLIEYVRELEAENERLSSALRQISEWESEYDRAGILSEIARKALETNDKK